MVLKVYVVAVLVAASTLPVDADACTTLIVGRDLTEDGSVLFAKTEDDGPRDVDYLWFFPRRQHVEGSVVRLRAGGTLPQVAETYAFFWDQCPRTSYSNLIVNEWGVAFGSNGCASREDSVDEVAARGDLVHGGIGFMLRLLLAQRSTSAREAVELAAALLDEYGYSASGRNLNIVGPSQAWQLQMVRGKQYVARRVRDDEVAIIANSFSIRQVDCDDRANFLCSPRLIEHAIERGWYDPDSDGDFEFARAYAPEDSLLDPANTRRQWLMARKLDAEFPLSWQQADAGRMPVSVTASAKLGVADVLAIMRSHYEGTELEGCGGPLSSPHRCESRAICHYTTHRTTVVHQRSWLPPDIGTVVWRALGPPCSSGFVPWYLGARKIPPAFQRAAEDLTATQRILLDAHFSPPSGTPRLDRESASCVFGVLGGLVDADYRTVHGHVRSRWSDFEHRAFDLLPAIDSAALRLHRHSPAAARDFLSLQVGTFAGEALAIARELIDTLEWNLWGTGTGSPIRIPVAVETALLERYHGTYRIDGGPTFRISTAGGQMSLQVEGGPTLPLAASSQTELFSDVADISFAFLTNEAGEVLGVVVTQGDQQVRADRIDEASGCN
jgi:dipeptidase